ncbi:MAG: hypothetical protein EBS07_06815 [Sphingobacteriia bacterium]|nr:hypothetical protein [Sphingobacteriia bacterium]
MEHPEKATIRAMDPIREIIFFDIIVINFLPTHLAFRVLPLFFLTGKAVWKVVSGLHCYISSPHTKR